MPLLARDGWLPQRALHGWRHSRNVADASSVSLSSSPVARALQSQHPNLDAEVASQVGIGDILQVQRSTHNEVADTIMSVLLNFMRRAVLLLEDSRHVRPRLLLRARACA